MTVLKKIFDWLDRSAIQMRYKDMESYLDKSQNIADLEDRMRRWESNQSRNGTFYLS